MFISRNGLIDLQLRLINFEEMIYTHYVVLWVGSLQSELEYDSNRANLNSQYIKHVSHRLNRISHVAIVRIIWQNVIF